MNPNGYTNFQNGFEEKTNIKFFGQHYLMAQISHILIYLKQEVTATLLHFKTMAKLHVILLH